MDVQELSVRRENGLRRMRYQGSVGTCFYSLKKLQGISLLSQMQSSHSENVAMLAAGERCFCVSRLPNQLMGTEYCV